MRSVQIEASIHHRSRQIASVPCLASSALPRLSCLTSDIAHPTSCLPSLRPVLLAAPLTAPRGIGTMKALTPPGLTQPTGLTAYFTHPSCHSDPNHAIRPMVAFAVASAPSAIPGFAIIQQARHGYTPKQVRTPTDWQFASGCSPPRLTTTQLPSTTELRHAPAGTPTLLTRRPRRRT